MKKVGYILLLIVCLLQSGGILFIYNVQRYYISTEMHQKLGGDDINTEFITLNIEQYSKSKVSSDEIRIDGKLFDIKSVEINNGKALIKCLHDDDEENLLKEIKQLLCISGDDNIIPPPQIHQLISLVYTIPCSGLEFLVSVNEQSFPQDQSPVLLTCAKDICTPPPEIA